MKRTSVLSKVNFAKHSDRKDEGAGGSRLRLGFVLPGMGSLIPLEVLSAPLDQAFVRANMAGSAAREKCGITCDEGEMCRKSGERLQSTHLLADKVMGAVVFTNLFSRFLCQRLPLSFLAGGSHTMPGAILRPNLDRAEHLPVCKTFRF